MQKKHIALRDCKQGDILAQSVLNNYGTAFVLENTCINSYIKDRLFDLGIDHIWIYESYSEKTKKLESKTPEEFDKKYKEYILTQKELLQGLASGKKLDMNKISQVSQSIYNEINNTGFIINSLVQIKDSDEYTYTHSVNVSLYAMLVGKWMGLPPKDIKNLIQAGLLHDIGKSKVSFDILNKPSRLLPDEFEKMKMHTVYGYEILKPMDDIQESIKDAVLMHHEREDNSGYPTGSNGSEVNIYAKIIAITDVYDAMISDRVYKKGVSPFESFEMFNTEGLKKFDINILWPFLSNLSVNYIGTKVKLSSGQIGKVVYVPPTNIAKPIININSKYIDTANDNCYKIECIL